MSDIVTLNGYKIKDEKAIRSYETVALMKADTKLKEGYHVKTKGYYEANDGGHGEYVIVDDDTLVDDGGSIHVLSNGLRAKLIIDNQVNVKQFGAKGDGETDDTDSINTMIQSLGYAYLPIGTYKTSNSITLTSNQSIYGEDKYNTIINYTGSESCITNEDIETSKNITIHDLTITGTNKTGYGIYLERTTKSGDTWYRLYNLVVRNFEYGVYLSKHLNEIQLSDVTTGVNQYGIYLTHVDDFYIERCVCAVNSKHGLYMTDTTEGRISDSKFWYNGEDNASTYTNLYLTSCTAINIVNVTCQESYGNNLRLTYSKNISLINSYLSKPSLDGNEHYQISIEHLIDSKIDVMTTNKKVNGSYLNKIINFKSENLRNNINVTVENDFPSNMKVVQEGSNCNYAFNLKNNINIYGDYDLNTYKDLNYIINGDISNTTDLNSMITAGRDYCSYTGGKLRISNTTDTTQTITFNHPVIPRTGLYTFYMKFKKVSGTGRVVMYYSGYCDVTADTTTSEDLYVSYAANKTSTASATNINFTIASGLTIDVEEIGMCEGITCNLNNPLYKKSEL